MQEISSLDDNKKDNFEKKLHENEEQISKLNEDVSFLKAQVNIVIMDYFFS